MLSIGRSFSRYRMPPERARFTSKRPSNKVGGGRRGGRPEPYRPDGPFLCDATDMGEIYRQEGPTERAAPRFPHPPSTPPKPYRSDGRVGGNDPDMDRFPAKPTPQLGSGWAGRGVGGWVGAVFAVTPRRALYYQSDHNGRMVVFAGTPRYGSIYCQEAPQKGLEGARTVSIGESSSRQADI